MKYKGLDNAVDPQKLAMPHDQSINQSIKYSFIDKNDNPPDTNASGFYRRVGGGKNMNN